MAPAVHHVCQEVPLTHLYMQEARCLSRADHCYLTMELVSLIPNPVKQEQTPAQSKTPKVGQQHPVDHPVKLVQLRQCCTTGHI